MVDRLTFHSCVLAVNDYGFTATRSFELARIQPKSSESIRKSTQTIKFRRKILELLGGFEPPTSSLPRMRSTD